MKGVLTSRNVTIDGHRTSLRLETETWDALLEICEREAMTLHAICSRIETLRGNSSRTSTVRAFVLAYFRTALHLEGRRRNRHVWDKAVELFSAPAGADDRCDSPATDPFISN